MFFQCPVFSAPTGREGVPYTSKTAGEFRVGAPQPRRHQDLPRDGVENWPITKSMSPISSCDTSSGRRLYRGGHDFARTPPSTCRHVLPVVGQSKPHARRAHLKLDGTGVRAGRAPNAQQSEVRSLGPVEPRLPARRPLHTAPEVAWSTGPLNGLERDGRRRKTMGWRENVHHCRNSWASSTTVGDESKSRVPRSMRA